MKCFKFILFLMLFSLFLSGCGKPFSRNPESQTSNGENHNFERAENLELLQRFISKQKSYLTKLKNETRTKIKEIDLDANKFSETLKAIEDDNIRLKKGAEYVVYEILNSVELNELALKYLDKDFQTERASFTESVRNQKKVFNRQQDAMIRSQIKYEADMQKINEGTRAKNENARRKLEQSNEALNREIAAAKRNANQPYRERRRSVYDSNGRRYTVHYSDNESQILTAKSEVRTLTSVKRLNEANLAQMEASEAETLARSKADLVLDSRHAEIEKMLAQTTHDKDMLNLSIIYRENAITRLQNQMLSKKDILSVRMEMIEKDLHNFETLVPMMDLMNAEELRDLRGRLARELSQRFDNAIQE